MCQSTLGSWKTKGTLHGRALTVLVLQGDGAPCQRLGRALEVLEGFMPSFSGNRENIPTLYSPSFFPSFPRNIRVLQTPAARTPGNQWLYPKLMDKARKAWIHIDLTPFYPKTSLWEGFFMVSGFYCLFGSALLLWAAGKAGISRDRHLDPIPAKPFGTRCWINVNRKALGII